MIRSRKEKEREKLKTLVDRFYDLETDKLAMIVKYGCRNAFVLQAIYIILKERGISG